MAINKCLENMIAIWTEPVPIIRYIGDTVEITYEIFERDFDDDSEEKIFRSEKGILIDGSGNRNGLYKWFTKGKIKVMAYGSPMPHETRMVLIEKNIYRNGN
jgi:hypothetical protein